MHNIEHNDIIHHSWYSEIPWFFNQVNWASGNLAWIIESHGFQRNVFERFLMSTLQKNQIEEWQLFATEYRNETFFLYLSNGRSVTFTIDDFKQYLEAEMLADVSLEEVEWRVQAIKDAMESIYTRNNGWIYNSNLDDTQLVESGPYAGKNMRELQAHLDIETRLLFAVYDLRWETKKKQVILKRKIKLLAWVWDKYETGAEHFRLTDEEIHGYVEDLIRDKSYDEIFAYIRDVNKAIRENRKRSHMTNQINGNLVHALYLQTYDKLKIEDAADEDFFELARVMTGRKDIVRERMNSYWSSDTYMREAIRDIDYDFRSIDMANQVLLYVMHRPWGVFDTLSEELGKIDIEMKDPIIGERSPMQVIQDSLWAIDNVGWNGWAILEALRFENTSITASTTYEDLNFEEKIALWTLARITKHIGQKIEKHTQSSNATDPYGQILIPDFNAEAFLQDIMSDIDSFSQESFQAIQDNMQSQFAEKTNLVWWFSGPTAQKLGIDGTLGKIFDLYQDINGNRGIFHRSDKWRANEHIWRGALLLWGALVCAAAIIILSTPALIAAASAATTWASAKVLLWAGAKIGFSIGVLDVILSPRAYDSLEESIAQHSARIAGNTALGAGFFWWSAKVFWPKLFTSKLISGTTWKDIALFWGWEGLAASMLIEPAAQSLIMQWFWEYYEDTDGKVWIPETDEERLVRLEREKKEAIENARSQRKFWRRK